MVKIRLLRPKSLFEQWLTSQQGQQAAQTSTRSHQGRPATARLVLELSCGSRLRQVVT